MLPLKAVMKSKAVICSAHGSDTFVDRTNVEHGYKQIPSQNNVIACHKSHSMDDSFIKSLYRDRVSFIDCDGNTTKWNLHPHITDVCDVDQRELCSEAGSKRSSGEPEFACMFHNTLWMITSNVHFKEDGACAHYYLFAYSSEDRIFSMRIRGEFRRWESYNRFFIDYTEGFFHAYHPEDDSFSRINMLTLNVTERAVRLKLAQFKKWKVASMHLDHRGYIWVLFNTHKSMSFNTLCRCEDAYQYRIIVWDYEDSKIVYSTTFFTQGSRRVRTFVHHPNKEELYIIDDKKNMFIYNTSIPGWAPLGTDTFAGVEEILGLMRDALGTDSWLPSDFR